MAKAVLALVAGRALLAPVAAGLLQAASAVAHPRTIQIVAPHPDGDIPYRSGTAALAVAGGMTVKVLFMANGDPPNYSWTQTGGPSVTVSGAITARPMFVAPATPATLAFRLVVHDVTMETSLRRPPLRSCRHTLLGDQRRLREGDPSLVTVVFTVSLSEASGKPVTVAFVTAKGTAVPGRDYLAKRGVVDIAPGVTTQALSVKVIGDNVKERMKRFTVKLSNPVNVTLLRAQGVGTIVDDD